MAVLVNWGETIIPATNVDSVVKFGRNADVDAAEDIWDLGGDINFVSAAAASTIVSDDANDDVAGTGARTVQVYGLGSSYMMQDETVSLDGVTPVNLSNEYLRIFRLVVRSAGSGGENAGIITASIGGTSVCGISAGNNQSLHASYTIPADYDKAWLLGWFATVQRQTNVSCDIAIMVRPQGEVWQLEELAGITFDANWARTRSVAVQYSAGTDIKMRCLGVSAVNADIAAGFELALRRRL